MKLKQPTSSQGCGKRLRQNAGPHCRVEILRTVNPQLHFRRTVDLDQCTLELKIKSFSIAVASPSVGDVKLWKVRRYLREITAGSDCQRCIRNMLAVFQRADQPTVNESGDSTGRPVVESNE